MKKIYPAKLLFMTAILIVFSFISNQAIAQTNILQNYSFETNDGQWWGEATYWEKGGIPPSPSFKGPTTIIAHQGTWSFSFGNDGGPADAVGHCLQVLRDPNNPDNLYPVSVGDMFTFSAWIQSEANYAGEALIKIEFYDYDIQGGFAGIPIACFQSDAHTGQFNWFKEIVSGTTPEGTVSVAVVCSSEGMQTGEGSSIVNFDEGVVSVERNLLLNFSFEDNTGWGGDADYWEKGGNSAYKGVIQANAHQGSWAFNIGNDGGPPGASSYALEVLRDPADFDSLYPVTIGEIIIFSMWMMREDNYTGDALLKIEFYDYNRRSGYAGAPIETFTSAAHTGKFAYFCETVIGVVPEGTVSIAVVCSSEGMDTGSGYSAVNFDDGCILARAPIVPKEVIDLNGSWQLEPSATEAEPVIFNYTVSVPGLVDLTEPAIPEVKDCWAYDYFWYKKTFTLTPSQEHSHAFLKIDQARYGTDVWLNGEYLGNYIGCFTSHKYDATNAINYDGENVFLVRVGQKRLLPIYSAVGYDYEEDTWIPGIWGDVSLRLLNNLVIERVQIIPHIDTSIAEARITVKNLEASTQDISISSRAFEKSGGAVASPEIAGDFTIYSFEKEATFTLEIPISEVNLWSPDNAFLYELISKIKFEEMETDTLTITFGMREFKIVNSDFYLNDNRIFLRGGNICFHRFLSDPEREGRPWNYNWIKAILVDIPQAYNFNFFRMHMGHANNKWYDIADEYGIMLEDEWGFRAPVKYPYDWVPGGPGYGSEDQIRKEFTQWLYDNWNHPSIIIWDAQNEPHDGGEQSIDIIRKIIIPEMKEIDPTRPWECGINPGRDFEPGNWNPIDFSEDHPYIYSKGPVLNNQNFGYSRSIDGMTNSKEPTLLNEYIWFWLKKNGETGNFSGQEVARWLGKNSTNEQRLKHQSLLASDLSELWRRLDIDGVAPFCYLSSSEAGTTNWLTDIVNPSPEKVLPIMFALEDAFAPFGVSIELWDRHFLKDINYNINVYIFNDTTQPKSGTLRCSIVDEDDIIIINVGDYPVNDVSPTTAVDMRIEPINWTMPSDTGTYYFKAELIEDSEVVATSKKIAHAFEPVIPGNLSSAKFMVYDPDNEILNYLTSLGLNAINYDSTQLSQQNILILGEGALLDTNYNSRLEEITGFVKKGHTLIIIEPSYNITNYEKQEYSLLSDLSIAMNKREDKFEGGYDSYCFIEENIFIEATASSIEDDNPEYAPGKAIDGNMETRWSSQHGSDPQWICVDFGQRVSISGVTLHWEGAYAVSYSIEVSDDKESWTEVYSTTTGDGDTDEITFSKITARYIRVYGSQRATEWGYSLYEFEINAELKFSLWNNIDENHLKMFNGGWGGEMISQCDVELPTNKKLVLARSGLDLKYANVLETVWGEGVVVISRLQLRGRLTEESDPGTGLYSRRVDVIAQQYLLNLLSTYLDTDSNVERINRALPFLYVKEVTASSVQDKSPGEDDPQFTPDKAIDNNSSTRWSSEPSDPQWLCLDLGESVKFNGVILRWENAFALAYQIQVSDNKENWTDVYFTASGNGGVDEIEFDAVTARYVRMHGTQRFNTEWGYSLYEFQAYAPIFSSQITGQVTLQGRTDHSEQITFELRNPGETIPINTYQITTAVDGSYTLNDLPIGTFDLTAKSSNTLRAKQANIIVIEDETTPNIDFSLLGGDADNNNVVSGMDFAILRAAYGTKPGDSNWDARTDFNGNAQIDGIDFSILRSNYGSSGAE